jgi:hypothetical protein
MYKNKYKLLILFVLISLSSWGNPHDGKYKKIKIIEKKYDVTPDLHFKVSNTYGNINISGWNKNTVEVKITIKVTGDDQKAVNEKLEQITVESKAQKDAVSFKTIIPSSGQSSWSLFSLFTGKSSKLGFEINYEIKVPLRAHINIINEYGHIFIDEIEGDLELTAMYGKLEAGELKGENNRISLEYFSGSQIDFIKNGNLKMDYSSINIDKAYQLKIIADYSKISIQKVRELHFINDYGYIKVFDAMVIKGEGDYQTRYFENINSLDFSGDYGSVKIVDPKAGFDHIRLECDYSNIKIINTNEVAYRFLLTQDYGCFKYDLLEFTKKETDGEEREVEAYFKDPSTSSIIDITADYGCIKIYNQP